MAGKRGKPEDIASRAQARQGTQGQSARVGEAERRTGLTHRTRDRGAKYMPE